MGRPSAVSCAWRRCRRTIAACRGAAGSATHHEQSSAQSEERQRDVGAKRAGRRPRGVPMGGVRAARWANVLERASMSGAQLRRGAWMSDNA